MIDPEVQPLKITVEVSYKARLYDGDPADAYEIADLEKEAIEDVVRNNMESVLGDLDHFSIKVKPG